MGRKRNKKRGLPPRCKRMNRSARLQSALSWLKKYDGDNILRGYCKHFAVDWRCAAIELRQLGVTIDEQYLSRRAKSEQQLATARQKQRESQAATETNTEWPPYDSGFEAWLAGDYAALHALEQETSTGNDS